jgi:hypothetical protein
MARPDSWFRFYNTTLDNPKAQRLPGELFKSWVNLLCLASRTGGVLPCNADVAFALRIDETAAETLQATLRERFLLDWDAKAKQYVPHDWDHLQFKSDVSTDRVQQYRQRRKKRHETVSETPPATAQEESRGEHTRGDSPKAPKGASYPEDFETWYAEYPHKVGKDQALRAWEKAKKSGKLPSVPELIAAVKRYVATKPEDIHFKNPGTWLHGGCWLDVPATAAPATPTEDAETAQWRSRVTSFMERGFWMKDQWGPKPGDQDCKVPANLLPDKMPPIIAPLRRTA